MRFNLNQKLTTGIGFIVIALTSIIVLAGNYSISKAINKSLRQDLVRAKHVFEFFRQSRFQQLVLSTQIVAQVPYLKAVVTTEDIDHATLLDSAREVQQLIDSDLFMIFDSAGKLLASVGEPSRYGDKMADYPAVGTALKGDNYQGVLTKSKIIYQVVSSPIIVEGNVAGALLVGYQVDQAMIDVLSEMTQSDVVLVTQDQLIASTSSDNTLILDSKTIWVSIKDSIEQVRVIDLNRNRYMYMGIPISHENEQGIFILTRSLTKELAFLRELQNWLLVLSLIIFFIFILLGGIYSKRITRPIEILALATEQFASGNFQSIVKINTNDEIGQLADSFNRMAFRLVQHIDKEKSLASQAARTEFEKKRADEIEQERRRLEEEVNHRKKAQEELRSANMELVEKEKTVSGMLEDLRKTHKDLSQAQSQILHSEKMASIGQLAAGIAHEINNPVGFVSSNIHVFQGYAGVYSKYLQEVERMLGLIESGEHQQVREAVDQLRKRQQEFNLSFMIDDMTNLLSESQSGLERVRKIVQDLRTFSHDGMEEMEDTRIENVIDTVLTIVNSQIVYKADLKKEYGETPLVKCNPQKLGQVFMNILVNACQAIKERGIIGVKTYTSGDYFCVGISDTGEGIPDKDLKDIFNPFWTTKSVGHGTGLGLSISYAIIKQHNGEIKVQSQIGQGTTFTIMLPLNAGSG